MPTAILIEDVINNAQAYAADILEQAMGMVSDAAQTAQGRVYLSPRPFSFEATEIDDSFVDDTPPEFDDRYRDPDASGIIVADYLDPYIPVAPDMPAAPPPLDTSGLFDIEAPVWSLADLTATEPVVDTDLTMPTLPNIVYPEAPDDSGIALTVPEVVVPYYDDVFAGILPDTIDVRSDIQAAYAQALPEMRAALISYADGWILKYCPDYFTALGTLEAKIAAGLQGGVGMTGAWEQSMYERMRMRIQDEHGASTRAVTEAYSKRGFSIPPGAVMGGMARAQFETSRNLSTAAAEVAIERGRLELQHFQFCMQISTTIRTAIINNALGYMQVLNSVNGQALSYAQELGKWAAEIFNQRAQMFSLELQRYEIESKIYTVKLESAFANLRRFEAEIEAEKLKIDVDRNAIALYEARIAGEKNKIEMYVAQFEGVRAELEVSAQQVSIYESQVRAYVARINGKSAEYEAYKAAIQGDAARVDAYGSQVQAYAQQVNAAAARVDAERSISQSVTEYNRALIDRQDAGIRKYIADVNAEGQRFSSSVEANKAAISQYAAEVDARVKVITTRYEKERLELSGKIAKFDGDIRTMIAAGELSQRSIATQAEIVNAGARILGDLAQSALTVSNAIVTQTGEG